MRFSLVPVLMLAIVGAAAGQDDLAPLVRSLGSTKFGEREEASRKLESLGEKAVPALRAAMRQDDLEISRRAVQIINKIEDSRVRQVWHTPRKVRIPATKTDLRDLDLRHLVSSGKDGADAQLVSLWEAVELFSRRSRLREVAPLIIEPEDASDDGQGIYLGVTSLMRLVPGDAVALPQDTRSSMRVRVLPFAASSPLRMVLEIRPDPMLPRFLLRQVQMTAIDDLGERMAFDTPFRLAKVTRPHPQSEQTGLPYFVAVNLKSADRTVRVTGTIQADVTHVHEIAVVPDVMGKPGEWIDGKREIRVRIEKSELDAGTLSVTLRIENFENVDVPQQPEVVRVRTGVTAVLGPADYALTGLEIRDRLGRSLTRVESSHERLPDGKTLECRLQVEAIEEKGPFRLIFSSPQQRVVEIPFVLGDVNPGRLLSNQMPPK